jgi:tetratricopeptide (TPR) repeat protein
MTIHDELIEGYAHHQAGQLESAKLIYEKILVKEPFHFDALQLLGMLLSQIGLEREGLHLLLKAVEINSSNPIVLNNLALLQHQLKLYTAAIESFDRAIELDPNLVDAHYNKGISLQHIFDFEGARASYLNCIRIKPEFFQAHINLGTIAELNQNFESALSHYLSALNLKQDSALLHFNLANTYKALNRVDLSLKSYDLAIHFQINYKEAIFNKAVLLEKEKEYSSALATYERVLQLDENNLESYLNRSIIFSKLQNYLAARFEIQKALSIQPDHLMSLNQQCIVLRHLGLHESALTCINDAISLDPLFAMAYVNKANVLVEMGELNLALHNYDHALELEPGLDSVHWNRALLLLQMKSFVQGWPAYEYRWRGADFKTSLLKTARPLWQRGDEDKRLLIWTEQGIGTEFMFAAFLKQVKMLSSRVMVRVDARGLEIYRRSFPDLEFYSNDEHLDEATYDRHLPIGSLPQYLFETEDVFKSRRQQYLHANLSVSDHWRAKLKKSKPLVGISWTTKSQITGKDRSIRLEQLFENIKDSCVDFVSLQYGDVNEEIIGIQQKFGVEIQCVDTINNFDDIDDLLSLIQACDLVLSIDNSTVHFAGAMGKRTCVMLPFNADWRWFDDGEVCLWYPSTKLLRQARLGQWDTVFGRVSEELRLL